MIETIKTDLPPLFDRDISTIFMPVIFALQTPNTFHGELSYRVIYWSLRLYGRLFFTRINLDLGDVEPVDENVIEAYWTVKGTLRLPWKPKIHFNGTSGTLPAQTAVLTTIYSDSS